MKPRGGNSLPTRDPFLYTLSFTAADGVALRALEDVALEEIERVRGEGVTTQELARAKRQLKARLVFENDSVTNVAHQLGYFETVAGAGYLEQIGSRIASVTLDQVGEVARQRLVAQKRTVGWFRPMAPR